MPRLFVRLLTLLAVSATLASRSPAQAVRQADRLSLLRDVSITSLTTGQALTYNGSGWVNTTLGYDASGAAAAAQAYAVDRTHHTGTQLAATISDFGAVAAAAAPVQSVAGRSGAVTLTKSDVGLGAVENTALSTWPGSAAITTLGTIATGNVPWARLSSTPTTLSGYGITDAAALSHTHAFSSLSGLPTTLAGYGITDAIALTTGSYANPAWITSLAWSKVASPPTTLAGYGITDAAALSHTHTFASLTSKPTTVSGYGITDAQPLAAALTSLAANSGTVDLSGLTLTLPAGFVTATGTQTLTNKTISGASNTLSSIGNASLTNSAITIAGTSTALGGSISASAILDAIGSTRGSLLYRGASGWAALTPGTSTYVLTSNGSGADPSWQAASGGGSPAGSSGEIQLNVSGSFGSTSNLSYDIAGQTLKVYQSAYGPVSIGPDPFAQGLQFNSIFGHGFRFNPHDNAFEPLSSSLGFQLKNWGSLAFYGVATNPVPAGQSGLYGNTSGEVQAVDSSGNVSIISPHAKDAPAEMYETGPGIDEMLRRANVYLGTVQWWATTRRQAIDALDMRARLGTPEDSSAAWTEVLQRRATGRVSCAQSETFEAYEQRTGNSLYPGATSEERAAWAAMTPLQRWDSVQQRDVAASVQRHLDWIARRDRAAAATPPQTFSEPEPALYQAVAAPAWIPR